MDDLSDLKIKALELRAISNWRIIVIGYEPLKGCPNLRSIMMEMLLSWLSLR